MNPFEMVVLIVFIVTIGRVLSHRFRGNSDRDALNDRREPFQGAAPTAETARLKDEVTQLKQRIQVLERIAVDKENSIAREIDQLRDR